MVVVPAAIAETVNALPLTETVATEALELIVPYARASPSGSVKRIASSSTAVSPAVIVCGGTESSAEGARFAGGVGSVGHTYPPSLNDSKLRHRESRG